MFLSLRGMGRDEQRSLRPRTPHATTLPCQHRPRVQKLVVQWTNLNIATHETE